LSDPLPFGEIDKEKEKAVKVTFHIAGYPLFR
jgi:hypothetical protein